MYQSWKGSWSCPQPGPCTCGAAAGCGAASTGPVSRVWVSSNIAWVESQSYILKVRAVDRAGNVSNEQSTAFTYDSAAPVSAVTSPANGQVYVTRPLSVSGTAQDLINDPKARRIYLGEKFTM